jgi:site-specific recombinase XerD
VIKTPRKKVKIPKVFYDIELEKFLTVTEHNIYTEFKKYALRDKLIFTMFTYAGLRRTSLLILTGMILL